MEVINHVSADVLEILRRKHEGNQVGELEVGTRLSVETRNSVYEIQITEGSGPHVSMTISGGTKRDGDTRYEDPEDASFVGSTFGGSLLKINWLGKNMCMEVYHNGAILNTSPVKDVVIENADRSWGYSMGWNNEDQF